VACHIFLRLYPSHPILNSHGFQVVDKMMSFYYIWALAQNIENKMPYAQIWIHLIFSTKNREPLITKDIKPILLNHIRENAKSKNIYIDFINAEKDHVHVLISLGLDQSIAKVAQLIKGESSFWMNKNKISKYKFEWQDEYIALSVSNSGIEKVRDYIKNQEEHHRVRTFAEEYDLFIGKMKEFGLIGS
jgi:putative transposase